MFKKMCTKCGELIPQGGDSMCEGCRATHKPIKADRVEYYKSYDKRRPEHSSYYKTKEWLSIRELVLFNFNYICQSCLEPYTFNSATLVHHIIPLEDNLSLVYDENNLIPLCNACHSAIHRKYDRNIDSKKEEQRRLHKAKRRWKEL